MALQHIRCVTHPEELRTETEQNGEQGPEIEITYSPVSLIGDSGGKIELRYLESLQDYVQKSLRSLEKLAIGCVAAENDLDDGQDCRFDESAFIDSYALRSQLPLRYPVTDEPSNAAAAKCDKLKGLAQTACLRTQKIEQLKASLTVSPELDERIAEFWILSKSRSRCRLNITDLGCLSNEKARSWQGKVGKRLLILPEDERGKLMGVSLTFDKHSAAWVDADEYVEIMSARPAT